MVSVCHVYWFYPPAAIGGIETFIQSLSTKLVEEGDTVTVVTGAYGAESGNENGVNVVRSTHFERYSGEDDGREMKSYELIKKVMRENSVEVLHVHNFHFQYNFPCTLAVYRAARDMGVPVILHVHGVPSEPVSEFIASKFRWDRVICVSKWVATKMYEKGVPGDRISAIYNGTDTERFKPGKRDTKLLGEMGIEGDTYVIGTPARLIGSTGAIAESKGYFNIMKALSHIKENRGDFKWVLTGGKFPNKEWMESAKSKMMDYARIYGIEKNVVIGYEVPADKMPAFYNSLDLMLMPSIGEPFGLSTIESMSCGRATVGANSGATTEIIRSGVDGFLVQPDNHIELSGLVLRLMGDDDASKGVRISARRKIVEKFSIGRLVSQMKGEYERVGY